jgi:hypothetical protein
MLGIVGYRLLPLLMATAVALAQTPVRLESRVDIKGAGEAVITNRKSIPLTAYLLQVYLEPCSPPHRNATIFRGFDAALSGEPLPLIPEQRILGLHFVIRMVPPFRPKLN